ncbi:hypothetical protein [Corynebacterium aquilae]|uniref:Uncharacterized protein n=1 Tax=Corynebacterium aquilae DSM 44791 TaxID=1431546 RepID=A0A1L7CH19_9CORY|nr:hypothetical protein [Corynebacterium aquilae]APT85162.1 hypothetical protein CAQU_08840 [Corynebacterium aquilae DSM 44791]
MNTSSTHTNRRHATIIDFNDDTKVANRHRRPALGGRGSRRNPEDLFYRVNKYNDPYCQSELTSLYEDERLAG